MVARGGETHILSPACPSAGAANADKAMDGKIQQPKEKSAMCQFAVGLVPVLLFCAEARGATVPLFPAASDNRQGFVRVVNPTARAGEVRISAYTDSGERRSTMLSFEEGEEVRH